MADVMLLSRFTDDEQNAIKDFVRTVANLPGSYDEAGIDGTRKAIKFLLARKFDVPRAVELYRCHQRLRNSEGIHNIDPTEEGVRRELLSEKFTVLPGRDPAGAGVALFTARSHWPPYTTHRDTLKGLIFQLDAALSCEETQRNGIVFIYDMTESRYANFDYDLSIKILNMLKGHYPARLRKVLIVTAPLWFRAPFQVLRLFVREKLRDRVHTVDKRHLTSHLAAEVLPTSLGGRHLIDHRGWLEQVFKTLGVRKRLREDYFAVPELPSVPGSTAAFNAGDVRAGFIQTPSNSSSPSRRGTPSGSSSEALVMVNGGEGGLHVDRTENGADKEPRVASMATIDSTSVDSDDDEAEEEEDDMFVAGDAEARAKTDKNDNNRKGILHGKRAKDKLDCSSPETQRSTKKRSLASCSSIASNDDEVGHSIHQAEPERGATLQEFMRKVNALGPNGLFTEYMSRIVPWSKEFEQKADFTAFRLPANRTRNRYTDVLCLDGTRVRLKDNSYIHANWVDSYKQKRAYICTQGPLATTAVDLWNMVWQYNVPVIVMVTRTFEGRRLKCFPYWPANEEEEEEFGDFRVKNMGSEIKEHYCKTVVRLTYKDEKPRDILHFYFTAWPDYGVPDTAQAFLDFLFAVRSDYRDCLRPLGFDTEMVDDMNPPPTQLPPPVVVHCSAGIGRTGTYITMDICLKRLADVGRIDLCETVMRLRMQRSGSIQMPQQYYFCHIALLEHAGRQDLRCQEEDEEEEEDEAMVEAVSEEEGDGEVEEMQAVHHSSDGQEE